MNSDEVVRAIKKGEAVKGSVTWTDSPDTVQLLKDLFNSFQPERGLTIMLTGKAKDAVGATLTRLRLKRVGREPGVEDVALLMLGKSAPWKLPSVQVNQGTVKQREHVEVRVVVPTHYRLAEIAGLSNIRACHLTGGTWNWQQIQPSSKREHSQLVGWLRLPKEEAQKLIEASGQRGIFAFPQKRTGDPPTIRWIKKLSDEGDEEYLQRVMSLAAERSQTPFLRKGLGTDLGFARIEADPKEARPKHIQLTNVPREWQAEEIRDLLAQQRWTNIEIHGRRSKRKQVFWNAKAQPPDETAHHAAWCYECTDEFCVTINENLSRPSLPVVSSSAPGPRRKWQDREAQEKGKKPDPPKKPAPKKEGQ